MKRRDFLQAVGLGAAATATVGVGGSVAASSTMDAEVDPDLSDFANLLNDLLQQTDIRPGWVVVPQRTFDLLESEMAPQTRFEHLGLYDRGHTNLLIRGVPVIPLKRGGAR